jgi:hypothetical protein
MVISNKGTTTGNATITVPFVNNFGNPSVFVAPRNVVGPIDDILGYIAPGNTYLTLWYLNTGATVILTDANIAVGSEMYFRFEYRLT